MISAEKTSALCSKKLHGFVLILSLVKCMVVNNLLTGLKQAKGSERKQIKRERFHDSETLKPGLKDAIHNERCYWVRGGM